MASIDEAMKRRDAAIRAALDEFSAHLLREQVAESVVWLAAPISLDCHVILLARGKPDAAGVALLIRLLAISVGLGVTIAAPARTTPPAETEE